MTPRARGDVPPPSDAPPRTHAARGGGAAAALLPPFFFALAITFFAAALVSVPFLAGQLRIHFYQFYQTNVLALTHDFTLGWISMAMIGVLYRYVPAITKRPLPFPGIAVAQAVIFVFGVTGLIVSFARGRFDEAAWAASLLLLASVLLCVNLWPLLLAAPHRGVAELGMLCSTGFLVAAATLGMILAADKEIMASTPSFALVDPAPPATPLRVID